MELPADEEREKCEHYGGELMVVAEGEKYAHTQDCHSIGGQETKHVLEGEGIGGRGDGHSNEDGEEQKDNYLRNEEDVAEGGDGGDS